MINEVRVSQDIQAFQKDIALDRLSSIVAQQARGNVIIVDDASTDGHAVEKTLKQTPDTFMQNMNKVSNKVFINIKNEKVRLTLYRSEINVNRINRSSYVNYIQKINFIFRIILINQSYIRIYKYIFKIYIYINTYLEKY